MAHPRPGAPPQQTELNDLLAKGGDGEVEAVQLLEDLLGTDSRFHVRKPPSRVFWPEG